MWPLSSSVRRLRTRMKKDIPPAWGTAYDRFGDPSESFTASRDGLVYLRGKIDEALEKGQATIGSEAGFDFQTIVVADVHPHTDFEAATDFGQSHGLSGFDAHRAFHRVCSLWLLQSL